MKEIYKYVLFTTIFLWCASCGGGKPNTSGNDTANTFPETEFAVMSDLHFYDPMLGTNGDVFDDYLKNDRKLLRESSEILESAVKSILSSSAKFVLVTGDLTKDGEAQCHAEVAKRLSLLTAAGRKVYVIPGNHDIRNFEAYRYSLKGRASVDHVDALGFASNYNGFGYGDAIESDPASLSYLAEPVPGLWLLALDSCRYEDNREGHESVVAGRVRKKTLAWMATVLDKSVREHKTVIAIMHHGLLEHYTRQKKHYGEYIVANDVETTEMLMKYGVKVIFTGHYHSQDATEKTVKTKYGVSHITDLETGSLVTWPCPWRFVKLGKTGTLDVETRLVESILSRQSGFQQYASDYLMTGITHMASTALRKYGLKPSESDRMGPQVAAAFRKHYRGDEGTNVQKLDTTDLGLWSRFVIGMREDLIKVLQIDLPPTDNRLTVDLVGSPVR